MSDLEIKLLFSCVILFICYILQRIQIKNRDRILWNLHNNKGKIVSEDLKLYLNIITNYEKRKRK